MHIILQDEVTLIDLDLKCRLTVIGGDSGIGKTYLSTCIKRIQQREHEASTVKLVSDMTEFETIPFCSQELVIIDNAEQYLVGRQLCDMLLNCSTKYFIVFCRGNLLIPATLQDTAELIWTLGDKQTANLNYYWR